MSARPAWAGRRLHFVGIGGAGMSGLAMVSARLGATVTGSDHGASGTLARLRARGISVHVGHSPGNVPEEDAELVYSSAVRPENPERVRARELGLSELRRGDLLAEVARMRPCIAVAGTHGKTTTAAMTLHALRGSGLEAGYLIGGDLLDTGLNAEWSERGWLVIETDESDRSLLSLAPDVAVLTNVELEHVREYRSRDELDRVFATFLAGAGQTVLWNRPELLRLSAPGAVTFDAPNPRLTRGGSHFHWREHEVTLRVPGEHNARNAAAALEASVLAGAPPTAAATALAGFSGTARRMQPAGTTASGALLYDDYAHHPTEVRATLAAARTLEPRRLVAVLGPHSFARARLMSREFGEALALADAALVLDVVPAGPDDGPPVSGQVIAGAARRAGCASVGWVRDIDAAEEHLRSTLGPGDLCVGLGPFGVDRLVERLAGASV